MKWNLVRGVLIARALSRWRRVAATAAAEPSWFLLVVVGLCGGAAAIMFHIEPQRRSRALGALALMLTVLLTAGQRDGRLQRAIGVSPPLARVIEALLSSFPLTLLVALHSLRDGGVIAGVLAATALLSADRGWRSAPRRSRRRCPVLLLDEPFGYRAPAPERFGTGSVPGPSEDRPRGLARAGSGAQGKPADRGR